MHEEPPGLNPPPIQKFITLDSTKRELKEYSSKDSGNSFQSTGLSMSVIGGEPRRGEKNSRDIYVVPDRGNSRIGFYNLSLTEAPVMKSQSGKGWYGSCGFLDDNTAVCSTRITGEIYTYDVTDMNNILQTKIADDNPSGNGFHILLITQGKQILVAYQGCIYIYTSTGIYINSSNSLQAHYSMYQMQEVRKNIIITAERGFVYSHNINNPHNTIINELLLSDKTNRGYMTVEGLEGDGYFALGGYIYTEDGTTGYVEIFRLEEDNLTLTRIPNKLWEMDAGCLIVIIREIQTGIIIFGGYSSCTFICTWEYNALPHRSPTCFLLGGRYIWDIIAL